MPFQPDEDITERIITLLQHEQFATISDISRAINANRLTVSKHLSRLVDDGTAKEVVRPSGRFFVLL
jgi:Mn-dependent DtxR family transcriptional regulator